MCCCWDGEYRLADTFKSLTVDTRKYVQMSKKQRERALKQIFSAKFEDKRGKSILDEMEMSDTEAVGIADENPLCQISIPQYVAEKVWSDGKELASQDSNVCVSPGCTDGSAWLVRVTVQHIKDRILLSVKKSGQLCCEKRCIMFNSCGVCAHIIAVAARKKCLRPSLTSLASGAALMLRKWLTLDCLKGAGKKTRSHRKFSTKSSMRKVKKILQDADSESYTPRPGITTKSLHNRSVRSPTASFSETDFHPYSTPDTTPTPDTASCSLPAQPPPPFVSPMAPPPLFSNLQACVDATHSLHHSPSVFTAASQECSYSQPSTGQSSLPAPPPLVRAPVQLSMAFMYVPMYLPCPAQQTHEAGQERDRCSPPFLLVFVKGNISRCAGCGKKNLCDISGKVHPPPHDLCLMHKEFVTFENPNTGLHQTSQERRNVYYHTCKACVLQKCKNPKVVVQSDIQVKLSSIHMHHIMEEFGL